MVKVKTAFKNIKNFLKTESPKKYAAVFGAILVLTLLLEIFVFNFKWLNSGGEEMSVDKSKVSVLSGMKEGSDGDYTVTADSAEFEIKKIDSELKYIYISPGEGNTAEFTIAAKDESNKNYLSAPALGVCGSVERSKYIRLHFSGRVDSLKFTVKGIKNKTIRPADIKFNVRVPFMFSWMRWLILSLALMLLYILRPGSSAYKYKTNLKSRKQQIAAAVLLIVQAATYFNMINWNTNIRDTYKSLVYDKQYYELIEAFKDGRLDVGDADQSLKDLDNPYDTYDRINKKVRFKWDHAYYDGKYYVYFGVVPMLLLYLPYNLITGKDLPNYAALYIFGVLLMIGIMLLLWEIIKKWHKNTPFVLYLLLSVVFVSSGACLPLVIQKPDFYLVPIIVALVMAVFGLAFWLSADSEDKLSAWRLALGSLFMALIAGCRPQLLIAAMFGVILFWNDVFKKRRLFSKSGIKQTIAVCLPFVIVAAGIMWYNFARFGSPFDFGANYNITTNDVTRRGVVFGRSALGIFTYIFQPLGLSAVFPFITSVKPATVYQGLTVTEITLGGGLWLFPISLFLLCGVFKKNLFNDKRERMFVIFAAVASLVLALLDAQMGGLLLRYMSDYVWLLVLGAFFTVFALFDKTSGALPERNGVTAVTVALSSLTIMLAFLVIFTRNVNTVNVVDANPKLYYTVQRLIAFWM